MGTFSKLNRFREAGQEANVVNAEKFGQPKKSLFTTTKLISFKHHIDITDNMENVVYQANTKVFSILDKTDITDSAGRQVAHIERKLLSFHERHYVTMSNGTRFELSNEFFRIIKDITNIEGLGWQLRGNILGLNFELYDSSDNIIAVISQKLISLHDKYCMDIYQLDKEQIVVAILITLQHMIKDRENSQAASYSSSN